MFSFSNVECNTTPIVECRSSGTVPLLSAVLEANPLYILSTVSSDVNPREKTDLLVRATST
jgi:hypothetical protein